MSRHAVEWNEVAQAEAPGGLTKRRIDLPGMSLVSVTVPAGTQGSRHSHPHDQFVQVVSGRGVLTTEQGERPFGPGSVFAFPRDTWHIARFDADTVLVETNRAAD